MQTISAALLLIAANGAPLLATNLFGTRFDAPIDGGVTFQDGYPLFGNSKTWRGVIAALLLTGATSWILGLGWGLGLVVATGAMVGDILSSFIKRRRGLRSSARAPGLDQLPESALPAFLLYWLYGFSLVAILLAVGIFILVSVGLSPLLYRWGLRSVPH